MKKIFLYVITGCFLISCDKTENEQDILDLFFGESNEQNNTSYEQMEPIENAYFQDFSSPESSDWKAANDEYGIRGIKNGKFVIQAKKSFRIHQNFTIDPDHDFQIEISMRIDFASVEQEKQCGIIYGVNNNKTFNVFSLRNNTGTPLYIGEYDGSAYKKWYEKRSALSTNDYHLYTIRKHGIRMSFYVDKVFKYETEYKNFSANYGFLMPEYGEISVDYVRADYLLSVMNME